MYSLTFYWTRQKCHILQTFLQGQVPHSWIHMLWNAISHTSSLSPCSSSLYRSCILTGQSTTNFLSFSPSPRVSCKQYKLSYHFYVAAEVQKERCTSVQALRKHAVLPRNWFPRSCTKQHSKKTPHIYFYKTGDHKHVLYLWSGLTQVVSDRDEPSSRSLFEALPQTRIWYTLE